MGNPPDVEITGNGPHLRMWIAHRQVGVQVHRYPRQLAERHAEPRLVPQYASQWVCDCGERGELIGRRNVQYSRIERMTPRSAIINDWCRHAQTHCMTRRHKLTLRHGVQDGMWLDG